MKITSKITKADYKTAVVKSMNNARNIVASPIKTPYVMIDGVPHKMINKQLVPLTRISK